LKKTETFIAALLLASLALTGALRFLWPAESVVAEPETPPATSPVEVVTMSPEQEIARTVEASIVDAGTSGPVGDLRDWVARDPHAAVDWAVQQPAGENRDAVLVAACYEIANFNPTEAVALAEKHALTNHATLANLAGQWAQRDLRAAHAWVLAKPAGEERNELAARVGYVWSASEPAAAAEFVVREIPPGSVQTEAAISILHQWALRSFDDAAAWVELFPERPLKDRALNELSGIHLYQFYSSVPLANE
jgi:hypothetical protein